MHDWNEEADLKALAHDLIKQDYVIFTDVPKAFVCDKLITYLRSYPHVLENAH